MRIKYIILLFIFSVLLASCEKEEETTLTIIDIININEETSSNPETLVTSIVGDLLFSPILYKKVNKFTAHNVLAGEVKMLQGNKVIEIKLKEGIRFHDGRKFTAKDILSAFEKLKVELVSKYEEIFKSLEVEVLDETIFRLTNHYPISEANFILSSIYTYPPKFSGTPVGTGPFKFSKWLNNGVELVANEDYFEGAPKIKKIIYLYEEDERTRLYKLLKGEADMMVYLSPDIANFLKKDTKFYVNDLINHYYNALFFNNSSPLFADNRVKKALSMGINRKQIIEEVLHGAGIRTTGAFPKVQSLSDSSQDYRPKEARKLLKEAGWKYDKKGKFLEKNDQIFKLKIYYTKGLENAKWVVGVIRENLDKIGIKVERLVIEHDEFMKQNLKTGDYDAYLSIVNSREPYSFIHWHSSSRNNLSSLSNQEVDDLLMNLRQTGDTKKRGLIYLKLQEIFNEEVPAAFLYNNIIYTAVNKKFKGAEDFVGDVYNLYKIKDWRLNEDYRKN